jgi:hypothetical protein
VNVADSVKQALNYWDRQDWDTALFHASNAVDATAKKRYPQEGVAARYKRTVRDAVDIFCVMGAPGIDFDESRFPIAVKSDLPDSRPDIADVLYGIHRHSHGHEDELPNGFELTPHGSRATRVHVWRNGKIQLPAGSALGLIAIAVFAPENKDQVIPFDYQLTWFDHVFHISDWWGWQDHFREIFSGGQVPNQTLDFSKAWEDWTPV